MQDNVRAFLTGYFSKEAPNDFNLRKEAPSDFNLRKEAATPELDPTKWKLGMNLPGGEVLQNPLVAGLGGAGLASLLQLLLSGGDVGTGTLIAALLGGVGLGGLSYGAQSALGGPGEREQKSQDIGDLDYADEWTRDEEEVSSEFGETGETYQESTGLPYKNKKNFGENK